jgi:hypothetical protein
MAMAEKHTSCFRPLFLVIMSLVPMTEGFDNQKTIHNWKTSNTTTINSISRINKNSSTPSSSTFWSNNTTETTKSNTWISHPTSNTIQSNSSQSMLWSDERQLESNASYRSFLDYNSKNTTDDDTNVNVSTQPSSTPLSASNLNQLPTSMYSTKNDSSANPTLETSSKSDMFSGPSSSDIMTTCRMENGTIHVTGIMTLDASDNGNLPLCPESLGDDDDDDENVKVNVPTRPSSSPISTPTLNQLTSSTPSNQKSNDTNSNQDSSAPPTLNTSSKADMFSDSSSASITSCLMKNGTLHLTGIMTLDASDNVEIPLCPESLSDDEDINVSTDPSSSPVSGPTLNPLTTNTPNPSIQNSNDTTNSNRDSTSNQTSSNEDMFSDSAIVTTCRMKNGTLHLTGITTLDASDNGEYPTCPESIYGPPTSPEQSTSNTAPTMSYPTPADISPSMQPIPPRVPTISADSSNGGVQDLPPKFENSTIRRTVTWRISCAMRKSMDSKALVDEKDNQNNEISPHDDQHIHDSFLEKIGRVLAQLLMESSLSVSFLVLPFINDLQLRRHRRRFLRYSTWQNFSSEDYDDGILLVGSQHYTNFTEYPSTKSGIVWWKYNISYYTIYPNYTLVNETVSSVIVDAIQSGELLRRLRTNFSRLLVVTFPGYEDDNAIMDDAQDDDVSATPTDDNQSSTKDRMSDSTINLSFWIGLTMFLSTILSSLLLTRTANRRRKLREEKMNWGIGTEQDLDILLAYGWELEGPYVRPFQKSKSLFYHDDDSMLIGPALPRRYSHKDTSSNHSHQHQQEQNQQQQQQEKKEKVLRGTIAAASMDCSTTPPMSAPSSESSSVEDKQEDIESLRNEIKKMMNNH